MTTLVRLLIPELVLLAFSLIALAVDAALLRARPLAIRFKAACGIAAAGCVAGITWLAHASVNASLPGGLLLSNPLVQVLQILILALTILALWLSLDAKFTPHVGEYVLLVLMATVGMLLLVASQDLLVLFIALELLSLCLYVLAAFDKRDPRSTEAAFKYFLFGGMSAAFLLFGFSLLYGMSNSTNLAIIGNAVAAQNSPLLLLALVMVAIGLGAKIGVVPFHFWTPDVYQGAPLPSSAFIAASSRFASFIVFYQIFSVAFAAARWTLMLSALAAASMVLGNLVAIVQTSVRRLLGYSAVAHAGYLALAVISHTQPSFSAMLFYLAMYALATLGAFAVTGVVQQQTGGDSLSHFAGLSRRSPLLAYSMMIFLLSLAGIPPLAGFFGKFYLFAAALATPGRSLALLWLVALAMAMSAVSLYYYLQVLKRIFVAGMPPEAGELRISAATQALVALLALAVLALGCAPNLLLSWINASFR